MRFTFFLTLAMTIMVSAMAMFWERRHGPNQEHLIDRNVQQQRFGIRIWFPITIGQEKPRGRGVPQPNGRMYIRIGGKKRVASNPLERVLSLKTRKRKRDATTQLEMMRLSGIGNRKRGSTTVLWDGMRLSRTIRNRKRDISGLLERMLILAETKKSML